ncbi:hypothetical protein L6452_39113 [Arctium lappa]|uniref:Uncharacterized protein n=1 Tax=Arctium lappa TaxID=4217 RepID=A0ACB8XS55_ARCLA|nr:hypothetical protein L6452_39113 [Arctium lappa]
MGWRRRGRVWGLSFRERVVLRRASPENQVRKKKGSKQAEGKERKESEAPELVPLSSPGKRGASDGTIEGRNETFTASDSLLNLGGGDQQTHVNCMTAGRKIEEILQSSVFENAEKMANQKGEANSLGEEVGSSNGPYHMAGPSPIKSFGESKMELVSSLKMELKGSAQLKTICL